MIVRSWVPSDERCSWYVISSMVPSPVSFLLAPDSLTWATPFLLNSRRTPSGELNCTSVINVLPLWSGEGSVLPTMLKLEVERCKTLKDVKISYYVNSDAWSMSVSCVKTNLNELTGSIKKLSWDTVSCGLISKQRGWFPAGAITKWGSPYPPYLPVCFQWFKMFDGNGERYFMSNILILNQTCFAVPHQYLGQSKHQ